MGAHLFHHVIFNIMQNIVLSRLFSRTTFSLRNVLTLLVAFFWLQASQAQVKIGINPEQIRPSSLLELESQTKGLLLPRLQDTLGINSLNPSDGMLIYLEKVPKNGLYVRRNGIWNFLIGTGGGAGSGGATVNPSNLTSGTASGQVLTWNGSSWEPKTIVQVSTAMVEKAREFNTSSGGNVVLEANSTNVVQIPISGAVPGDIVLVALIGDTPDFSVYNAWVSATNQVSIRFANYQPEPVTIIGTQYKVLLMK
jgi:hypothetical protein